MLSVAVLQRRRAVHPHGRGDNVDAAKRLTIPVGSPPRAWGQCSVAATSGNAIRFTPTGVGTMLRVFVNTTNSTVHPHGRGDNIGSAAWRITRCGSPPRAWGQCNRRALGARVRRFTPTGVGTMRDVQEVCDICTVHPHGRGDNRSSPSNSNHSNGSPPRAWGQCRIRIRAHRPPRFTPTGVGTMTSSRALNRRSPVHPHGRGDNTPCGARAAARAGSPPRAWGQCRKSGNRGIRVRFTPTGVGTI